MICAFTHHLHVVGIEGLFVQGELLRSQRVVQLDHLRKLPAGINKTVREQSSRGEFQTAEQCRALLPPKVCCRSCRWNKGS